MDVCGTLWLRGRGTDKNTNTIVLTDLGRAFATQTTHTHTHTHTHTLQFSVPPSCSTRQARRKQVNIGGRLTDVSSGYEVMLPLKKN